MRKLNYNIEINMIFHIIRVIFFYATFSQYIPVLFQHFFFKIHTPLQYTNRIVGEFYKFTLFCIYYIYGEKSFLRGTLAIY